MENTLNEGKSDVILCEKLDKTSLLESRLVEHASEYGQIIYLLNGRWNANAKTENKRGTCQRGILIPGNAAYRIRNISR